MRSLAASLVIVLLSLSAATVAPRPASAQGTVAVTQFKEAKKLYEEEKYADALQLFQLAWEHSHSPNARLYIARCFKKLGKNKPAYDEFRGTLRDATERLAEDEKYQGTQSAAAAELVLLEPKVGHLIISLDPGDAKGIAVTLNGQPLPSVSLGAVMTVDPGPMKVVAKAEGKPDVVREVNVSGGRTEALAIYFPVEATAQSVQPKADEDEGMTLSTLQLVGVIMGSVGVATMVAAAGTGIAAGSKFGALESACGEGPCADPSYDAIVDSGKTFELISYILLGGGGALAIAGTGLFLFGGDDEPTEPAATALVVPLMGGGFVGVTGRF